MPHLRISPRNLGQMQTKSFCPRCFWYQLKLNFRMPFSGPMPGILFNLDIFEKKLVEAHLNEKGVPPKWIAELGGIELVDFPRKMTIEVEKYDLTLVGMCDAVFRNKKGNLVLVDYKTARFKGADDPFMAVYEIQLLGYAHLLEQCGIGTVETAALVYFHNLAKEHNDNPLELITSEGMTIPFQVIIHEVPLDRTQLDPLMSAIHAYADMRFPPEGLAKCSNCRQLQLLLDCDARILNLQDYLKDNDQLFRRSYSPRLDADRTRARLAETMSDEEFMSKNGDMDWMYDTVDPSSEPYAM